MRSVAALSPCVGEALGLLLRCTLKVNTNLCFRVPFPTHCEPGTVYSTTFKKLDFTEKLEGGRYKRVILNSDRDI